MQMYRDGMPTGSFPYGEVGATVSLGAGESKAFVFDSERVQEWFLIAAGPHEWAAQFDCAPRVQKTQLYSQLRALSRVASRLGFPHLFQEHPSTSIISEAFVFPNPVATNTVTESQ